MPIVYKLVFAWLSPAPEGLPRPRVGQRTVWELGFLMYTRRDLYIRKRRSKFSEVRTQPAHVPSASECVGWLPCVPSTGLGRLPHPPGDDEKPDAPRKHQG